MESSPPSDHVVPSSGSTRRWWIALAGVGVAVAILWGCWVKGPTAAQVERRVRAALPIGTTQEQAEAWLRAEGIAFVTRAGATKDKTGQEAVAARAGMAGRQVGRTIKARVEPAFVSLVWEGDVSVYLFFDLAGRLIGYAFVPFAHAL